MTEDISGITFFHRLATALLIGFLIGLQREYIFLKSNSGEPNKLFAGIRTYGLLSLLGFTSALLADVSSTPWIGGAVLLVIGLFLAVSHFVDASEGHAGLTTEVSVLLAVICGALCHFDMLSTAASVAVVVTLVLALKEFSQKLLSKITTEDIYATLKFAVIAFIVLPILPRESTLPAPFDVLVPYKIWLMVCFISGISFLGYILIKLVGAKKGIGLAGLLGGLASSTAVTLTFSQRSQDTKGLETSFALAILLAWWVMFVRVLVEVAAINPPLVHVIVIPIGAVSLITLGYCYWLYRQQKDNKATEDVGNFSNPFRLAPAIKFGVLYGLILVVANVARLKYGEQGVYLSSIVSGLVDVDAITLSMAELSQDESNLSQSTAAKAIMLAAISNTLVKGGIVLSTGSKALRKVILPGLILVVASSLASFYLI